MLIPILLFLLLPLSSSSPISPSIFPACNATRSPSSCSSHLSSLPLPPNPSPSLIILTLFNSSLRNLPTARSILANFSSSSDPNRSATSLICLQLLSYSSLRLSSASSSPLPSPDSLAWTAASLLYLSDCSSALNSLIPNPPLQSAINFISDLANRTADALAMLAALHRYGPDVSLWGPPQTERDGYWDRTAEIEGDFVGGGVPTDLRVNVSVCKEGGCDFGTVQEAVEAAPENLVGGRFVIWIKKGVYDEIVRVPYEKTNLVFVGDGMGETVITGGLSADQGFNTFSTATVAVAGDGFMARDLTFQNTAGVAAHQAVAFRSDADFIVLDTVEFDGHQDTLYAHSLRQYFKSCIISGTVDFIFGNSAAIFEDCLINIVTRKFDPTKGESDTITAHGRTDPAQPTGFVFHNCRLNASEEYWSLYRANKSLHRVYLGRPWKEFSRTVFIGSYLEEFLKPEGWLPWAQDFALKTLFYGEFGNIGPGADVAGRVTWSNQIPAEHLGVYSVQNFIQGDRWIPQAHLQK